MANRQEWYVTGGDALGTAITATVWEGQTFTLGTTGDNLTFNLTSVQVNLWTNNEDSGFVFDAVIQAVLPDGTPDGTDLSTGTSSSLFLLETGDTWVKINMTPTTLQASKQYVLILKKAAGSTTAEAHHWREDASAPGYTGGTVQASANSGTTWTGDATADKLFQINGGDYEGTLCTLADAVSKAGANAASGATNEILVSDFVKQAEGLICGTTRLDWVTAYSGLSEQVKYILNRAASALAAIDIIAYDMSAYTAETAEAETMINIYREEATKALELIGDQNTKTFIVGDT